MDRLMDYLVQGVRDLNKKSVLDTLDAYRCEFICNNTANAITIQLSGTAYSFTFTMVGNRLSLSQTFNDSREQFAAYATCLMLTQVLRNYEASSFLNLDDLFLSIDNDHLTYIADIA